MKKLLMTAFAAAALTVSPVLAQDDMSNDKMAKPSDKEMKMINDALSAFGCSSGTGVEKEPDGLLEVEDAECKGAKYDVKIDDEGVRSMTRG